MSMRDTTFTYYAGNSKNLAEVGYDRATVTLNASSTPSSTVSSAGSGSADSRRLLVGGENESRRSSSAVTLTDCSRRNDTQSTADSGTSALNWSTVNYTIRDIVGRSDLPIIARVSRGYSGHDDGRASCQLAVGQVLQVSRCCEQSRINATDETGRQLSLPYDSPMTVRPMTEIGLDHPRRLSRAVDECVLLPMTVRVVDVTSPSDTESNGKSGSNSECIERRLIATDLIVNAVYQCQLVEANLICDGWLNPQRLLIPCDLLAEVNIATGLNGAMSDEWADYKGMFARAARQRRLDHVTGYDGMYYFDWSGRQPPPPPSTASNNGRLNVHPYIIANNVTVENDGAGERRNRQQARDSAVQAHRSRSHASPSARTAHNRPLPPYRPPGGVSSASSSCAVSAESVDSPAEKRVPAVATPLGRSTRDSRSPHRSTGCILPSKPRVMTSSLSSSSSTASSSSAKSLPVSGVEIEMRRLDVNGNRSSTPKAQCDCICETDLTSSDARRPPTGDSNVACRQLGNVVADGNRLNNVSQSPISHSACAVTAPAFQPTNYPRMGKGEPRQIAVMRKNNSTVVISGQRGSAPGIADVLPNKDPDPASIGAFGGSMPCLQTMDDKSSVNQQMLQSNVAIRQKIHPQTHQQSRVRFSVDFSTASTSGGCVANLNDAGGTHRSLETSGSSLFDEEGYYTKESSMSGFSTSGTCSSVDTASSHRLHDVEPAFF